MMKQGVNPYLPGWEYVPDGEPYIFGDRVYVYGSHDRFRGYAYCLNDYVCWSAPVKDLSDWRYEGVIYKKTEDPANCDGEMCLYAPDVTQGYDGRYYLYYVLDELPVMSVAVCDTPAGEYHFYGYVHYEDGVRLGEKEGDLPQFDPGVLCEAGKVYLYSGFCSKRIRNSPYSQVIVLREDMVTVAETPRLLITGKHHALGTVFEDKPFFAASSIRKIGEKYYFIYSSVYGCSLCYAVSDSPVEGFVYGGMIVSNNDTGIDSYKPALKPMYYGGNNHGSIICIEGQWYVFYHRHTDGTNYSRQGCIEPIEIAPDGSIAQVEMTSCGPNNGPLRGEGTYPAYIACNLFCDMEESFTGTPGGWIDSRFPK
ncbi:MAG: family 43 glycosylhydrolase, partial [Lachnospiraceae bacterium]|nr:family 43 glycosylhydrolase [Lachnospiraceae bacterium]